ncbi:MAG: 50S ribosomal protein L25 [Candidatus Limnocylindrales bacterium]
MSATPTVLTAASRTETGKAVARLRRAGKIPAVVFGHGLASLPVTLDAHEFDLLRRTVHSNSIISLKIDGQDTRRVMVHGIHIDPRTRHLLHVDLFALKSGEEVTVEIPLHTVGEAYAAARLGGTLLHTVDHVRVRALPEKLPEALEVSVEPLVDFDASVHLRDVVLPPGVTLLADPDEVVAKVAAPHVVEEPVAVVEEEPVAEAAPATTEAKPSSESQTER